MIPLPPERVEADRISATSINLTWIDNNENTRFYSVCVTETTKPMDCAENDLMKRLDIFFFLVISSNLVFLVHPVIY